MTNNKFIEVCVTTMLMIESNIGSTDSHFFCNHPHNIILEDEFFIGDFLNCNLFTIKKYRIRGMTLMQSALYSLFL